MKKLLKITKIAMLPKGAYFSNYQRYRFQILIAEVGDLNKDSVDISHPYLLNFPRNKLSKSDFFKGSRAV